MVRLHHWLLWVRAASSELQNIAREFENWMTNLCSPLAAYRELILGRLIGVDKCAGVRSAGVSDTCWRLLVKCVVAVTGEEANEAYGTEQIYGGLEARIEGGIHTLWILRQKHIQEEN